MPLTRWAGGARGRMAGRVRVHRRVKGSVGQVLDATDNPFRFSTKWLDTELAGASIGGAVGETGLGYRCDRYAD